MPRRILVAGDFDNADELVNSLMLSASPAQPQPMKGSDVAASGALSPGADPALSSIVVGSAALSPPERSLLDVRTSTVVAPLTTAVAIFSQGRRIGLWSAEGGRLDTDAVDPDDDTQGRERHDAADQRVECCREALTAAASAFGLALVPASELTRREAALKAAEERVEVRRCEVEAEAERAAEAAVQRADRRRRKERRERKLAKQYRRHHATSSDDDDDAEDDARGEANANVERAATTEARVPTTVGVVVAPPRTAMNLGVAVDDDDDAGAPEERRDSVDSDLGLLVPPSQATQREQPAPQQRAGAFTAELEFTGTGEVSVLPPRRSALARMRRQADGEESDSDEASSDDEDIDNQLNSLQRELHVTEWTAAALNALTGERLRKVLRAMQLPVSGTKPALIDRILNEIDSMKQQPGRPAPAAAKLSSASSHHSEAAASASSSSARVSGRKSHRSPPRTPPPQSSESPSGDEDAAPVDSSSHRQRRRPPQPSAEGDSAGRRSAPMAAVAASIASVASRVGSWFGSAVKRMSPRDPSAAAEGAGRRSASTAVPAQTYDDAEEARRAAEVNLFGSPSAAAVRGSRRALLETSPNRLSTASDVVKRRVSTTSTSSDARQRLSGAVSR